jgi:hypothetical protein
LESASSRLLGVQSCPLFAPHPSFVRHPRRFPGQHFPHTIKKQLKTPNNANDPKTQLAELKRMIRAQEQAVADLRAKLEEIDKLL